MVETVNVPGSVQPAAAAHYAACLPHDRAPSFIPAIQWQVCIPWGTHSTFLPALFPAL